MYFLHKSLELEGCVLNMMRTIMMDDLNIQFDAGEYNSYS